jgi:large subunit ribosomal protein L22
MESLLRSAIANASSKGFSASQLFISEIQVNGGLVFKRSMPRARGRASAIRKKTSHITIALAQKAPKAATPRPSSGQEK